MGGKGRLADHDELSGLPHFRDRRSGREQRATALELFFDLVFVFAITQLSHLLVDHLTWSGAAQTLFLLLVVWWGWNYTTWMTNFVDPESPAVRVVLLLVMLASLLMSIAIPEAFGDRAALFAIAYVAMQVIRNAFMAWATPAGSAPRRTFSGILIWSLATGALFVAGAFLPPAARNVVWVVALVGDFAGPAARYWVPGRAQQVTTADWGVDPHHFSERFQLFIIIALGESIVVTGATAAGLEMDAATAAAVAVAFVGSAALWWLYFDRVAALAGSRLASAEDAGRLARDGFTYLHIPIIAGIIVTAVGDEIVIQHPGEVLHGPDLTALVAGPIIYLAGHVLFRLRMTGTLSRTRPVAMAAILACAPLGLFAPALVVATAIAAVLAALVAWETVAGARREYADVDHTGLGALD
jgi:low temperature requirement protein LtrA